MPGDDHYVRFFSRFANILFQRRTVHAAIRNSVNDRWRAWHMVNPKPGFVESLDGIIRNTAPVICGRRCDRVAHRRAADETNLSPVALDNGGPSGVRAPAGPAPPPAAAPHLRL